ncbi:tetratricopeptide repeat protein [Streptomyces antarcticus]|uniref:tetratricopeptide repeat protein n=1 Tax=Streptomyces antarcticus TaxID=2996458 RepID=UPI002271745D|nr:MULTISPECIES: tetratricopeptide repeat protein [unclassified Streptomyces]MCY0941813.1 tetratricopeptide repeat protein [Streptomyces sp. H34-AA3]MCZ4081477.1 tetratricopeptide repeat protein [Streptomyces sp. H34-S5]
MTGHYWISAPRRRERDLLRAGLGLPSPLTVVDAHRRLRGPYTAAGELLRQVAPDALRRQPELAARHYIELQESTPELASLVPPKERALEQNAKAPGEATRYPARLHSLRVAHGLVDFLLAALPGTGDSPRTLVVENVHHADVTDREFLAAALRRIPAELLTLVVATDTDTLADPPGMLSVSLPSELATRTTRIHGPGTASGPGTDGADDRTQTPLQAAARYVEGECVDDDPALHAAYRAISDEERAGLHDRRAAALASRAEAEPSLKLGALPYHLLRGSDSDGAGLDALRWAQARCKYFGFYHAAAEMGEEGRHRADPVTRPDLWWPFTRETGVCLAAAGRPEESAAVQEEARAATAMPKHHMSLAYETGMLYARHFPPELRDDRRARAYVNQAIAISDLLPDPKERAFYSVFNRNGLALVEVRAGRPDEALRLLDEGIERLDRELGIGERTWHRVGLRYNRAQVNGMSGRLEEALADYASIIDADSDFADHYFNRGSMLRRLGRVEEAIADYERALALEPPFPEAHYNRGEALLELGDAEGARADFDRTLELEPGHLEALLARAGLLADQGDDRAALEDVTAGLRLDPEHPHLLCLRGRLWGEEGRTAEARASLSEALRLDPELAEAWAIKAELAFLEGDLAGALADFDRAVDLEGRPDFRFNRGVVHEAAGSFERAVADFEAVLAVTDDSEARSRRETCLRAAERAHA